MGSELCALFRGTVFPPVETAGAEALWLERLVVSRQQEIEGVQERRGKEDLRLEGGGGPGHPGQVSGYPRCDRELPKGSEQ